MSFTGLNLSSFLKAALLGTFLIVSLWGCAVFEKKEVAVAPIEETKNIPAPKPTLAREPGSLWREDSAWTEFYSTTDSRLANEILFIKPNDRMKAFLAAKVSKGTMEEIHVLPSDHQPLVSTIKEVLPRKMYSVVSQFKFHFKLKEYEATLTGKVKEQSIGSDDLVGFDNVLDVDLVVRDPAPSVTNKKNDKETSETIEAPTVGS